MADARDCSESARIATEAGAMLVEIREEMFAAGMTSWDIKDEGDRQAHVFIMEQLQKSFPGDAILSEEGRDDLDRLNHERVWIVDPLDGTPRVQRTRQERLGGTRCAGRRRKADRGGSRPTRHRANTVERPGPRAPRSRGGSSSPRGEPLATPRCCHRRCRSARRRTPVSRLSRCQSNVGRAGLQRHLRAQAAANSSGTTALQPLLLSPQVCTRRVVTVQK